MKTTSTLILSLGLSALGVLAARGDNSALSGNPYTAIQSRNAFNLVPLPAADPADAAPYAGPAAKITPNGLMTLFGAPQVLFKVATPVGPGQPLHLQSYVMSEGDQADGITVTRIDASAHVITFDNHGTVQTIPLADAGVSEAPIADATPATPNPPTDQVARGQLAQPVSPVTDSGVASGSVSADNGVSPAASGAEIALNDSNHLTPEAQAISIEAQRQRLQQQGDPSAMLIPPTEITQTTSGADQSLAVGSSSPPSTP